ncbi:flagellar basal-body MS-ring/collar protein FliF [Euzebya sp.]|uniref:flagellar basal-body MS-ring/collar protein FliF n=1 Tax=Euzebya sp. TaxID=1971409 RepID=UPI0035168910
MSTLTDSDRSPRQALGSAREKAEGFLSGFTTGQKAITILAVAGLVVAGMFFMRWVSQPSMAPLFSDVDASAAAAITDELDAQGVAYELTDGGRTILVERSQQAALRLDMSGAGLMPTDGSGFSILDDNGVTTPQALWDAEYQRAIEGELAATIGSMELVESARVHLVMPTEDLFTQDNQQATASVFLSVAGTTPPTPMQIQSIVNLVAGSVEGLEPSQVTVTDTAGNMLAAPGEEGQMAAIGDARQYQTNAFETRLADNVEQMLQQVVGPEAAVVTVTADLNFDSIAQTNERFGNDGPAGGIPLETTTTTENYEGVGAEQTGVLGPDGQVIGGGEGDQTTYELADGSTRFAVDRTVEEILQAPGGVNRLSVAVLLDAEAQVAADPQNVQALVEAAVGFDAARGDLVQVSALPFDQTAAEAAAEASAAAEAAAAQERMYDLIKSVASVLIVLIVLFLAWRSARKSMAARAPQSIPLDIDQLGAGDDDEDDEPEFDFPQIERGPTITDEVAAMIDDQGEEMAGLLRGWMAER